MEAIDAIRAICDEKCFLAGFSVVIKDTKDLVDRELPIYVGLAVALSLAAMSLTMESVVLPFAFLASIGMAILYNFGTNIFLGEISYITQAIAAVLQLGVTMDYSILLAARFREELQGGKTRVEAIEIAATASDGSIITSSLVMFCATLGVGLISEIEIISSICVMLARGALISAVMSMFLMPSILCVCEPLINKTSLHWRRAKAEKKQAPADTV